jgi:hypothetical protein
MSAPTAHQSTPLLCPKFKMISGARYSGVPQMVHVLRPPAIDRRVSALPSLMSLVATEHRDANTVDGTGVKAGSLSSA